MLMVIQKKCFWIDLYVLERLITVNFEAPQNRKTRDDALKNPFHVMKICTEVYYRLAYNFYSCSSIKICSGFDVLGLTLFFTGCSCH